MLFRSVDAVAVTCPAWIEWDSAGIDTHNSGEIRMGSNHILCTGRSVVSDAKKEKLIIACGLTESLPGRDPNGILTGADHEVTRLPGSRDEHELFR